MALSTDNSDVLASQLIVASPWWQMILREEAGWLRRAQRVHACIHTQALAYQSAADDIKRMFVTCEPSKDAHVCSVARECAASMSFMANKFVSINVHIKRLLDGHNDVLMLEQQSQNPFMSYIQCIGELLQIARYECMYVADIFEKRFPLLQEAIQASIHGSM